MALPTAVYTKTCLLGGVGRRVWIGMRHIFSPLDVHLPATDEMRKYERSICYATQRIEGGVKARLADIVEVVMGDLTN